MGRTARNPLLVLRGYTQINHNHVGTLMDAYLPASRVYAPEERMDISLALFHCFFSRKERHTAPIWRGVPSPGAAATIYKKSFSVMGLGRIFTQGHHIGIVGW